MYRLDGYGITERPCTTRRQRPASAIRRSQGIHFAALIRDRNLLIELFRHRRHSFVAMSRSINRLSTSDDYSARAYPSLLTPADHGKPLLPMTLAATVVRRLEAGVTICGQPPGGP